jgi:ribosomal protein L11 methyltransferase
MRPDELLAIYEIRSKDGQSLKFLAGPPEPEERFGQNFAGIHFEGDFAFLFFVNDYDIAPFLAEFPFLEVREIHRLRYDQWRDGALVEPMVVGPLTVRPAPLKGSLGESKDPGLTVYVDPGLAFGYGGHPTTRDCLGFLTRLLAPGSLNVPSIKAAVDFGSGSGILALAALRLGAVTVLGVDHSHLAVRRAVRNAALNGLLNEARFEFGLAQDYALEPGELAMANLPFFVQKDLIALGAFDGRDYLIVSGLLTEEGEPYLSALSDKTNNRYRVVDWRRDDRWASYFLAKRNL